MSQTIKQNPQNRSTHNHKKQQIEQLLRNDSPHLQIHPNSIINISFIQEKKHHSRHLRYSLDAKLPNFGFKTFYQTVNYRKRNIPSRQSRDSERGTAFSDRQLIVGTPFRSLEDQNDVNSATIPLLDSHRYRYLLKAISTVYREKKLTDLTYGNFLSGKSEIVQTKNNLVEDDRPIHNLHNGKGKTSRLKKYVLDSDRFQGNRDYDESLSPSVINISPQIRKIRHNKRNASSDSPQKQNPYQAIFKNKKKLHNKYWSKQIIQQKHQLQLDPKQQQFKIQQITKNDLSTDRKMKYIKNAN